MYDERANGFGRGEGVGCIVLKPLAEALKDGDSIRGVIRNSGINQDGRTVGITFPSSEAQTELIERTYKTAGLDPVQTSYVVRSTPQAQTGKDYLLMFPFYGHEGSSWYWHICRRSNRSGLTVKGVCARAAIRSTPQGWLNQIQHWTFGRRKWYCWGYKDGDDA